jgi:hypothetical protein
METALTQDRSASSAPRSAGTSAPQIEHVVNGKKFAGCGTRNFNVFYTATVVVVGWLKAAKVGGKFEYEPWAAITLDLIP